MRKALDERPSSRCQGGRRDAFVLFFLSRSSLDVLPLVGRRMPGATFVFAPVIRYAPRCFVSPHAALHVCKSADSANRHRTPSTCQPACRGRTCRKIMFATNMCLIMNAGLQPDRIELSVSAGPESNTHWSDRSVQAMPLRACRCHEACAGTMRGVSVP